MQREKEVFICKSQSGEIVVLMEVRAFLNGNLHIKFNQDVIKAMNVEVGRLLGWVHNEQHAAYEMGENVTEITKYFKTTYTALPNQISQLLIAA